MIWNIVGYPAISQPIPFLVHSNVILGFLLAALYGAQIEPNWAMMLMAAVNACSICALIYIVLQSRLSMGAKWIGCTVILAGLGTATLNLTFTFTAALSSLSGLSLILLGARRGADHWMRNLVAGVALVLAGALIRLEMLGLVLAIVLPGAALSADALLGRRCLIALGAAGALVAGAYLADKLYVRSFPQWNAFYAYDQVREDLHDAHRLVNLHNQIRHIGWTPNDQELFAHWFFPDADTYSFEHIKYLVQNTSGTSQDLGGTVTSFLETLVVFPNVAYLILMAAIAAWTIGDSGGFAKNWTILMPWLAAFAANLLLIWAYKDPAYVSASTLAGSAAWSVSLLAVRTDRIPTGVGSAPPPRSGYRRLALAGSLFLIALGTFLLLGEALQVSRSNVAKQAAYATILSDISRLQATGAMEADALIVSPAHGLPYEWSYPFTTSLPAVSYFDTGWITFSPTYDRILQDFGVTSLPEALYQDSRLYLMAESSFTGFLRTYYQEHGQTSVQFVPVYRMPNPLGLADYDDIWLYKIVAAP